MSPEYYSINCPRIIYENVNNEIIIIDTLTGSYFSLKETGSQIWYLIAKNNNNNEIVQYLFQNREADINQILKDVKFFLQDLLDNNLIIPLKKPDANSENQELLESKILYVTPKLNKFTDMQDLLLIDPIHDVNEEGWPNRA
ncbi:PqqD family protein [Geminocystis sp. GBBB08]|uniref:PqqD family protein n=1 Tax=Geminocystis sp. GBBB08 TaxID=2604140 RepID=UPI0027E36864|nr:PqqD family protein [Geminocystis sp. GBBB08]MBL1209353.1 PqqD family protein [Geminocystis sp. GBBB08]